MVTDGWSLRSNESLSSATGTDRWICKPENRCHKSTDGAYDFTVTIRSIFANAAAEQSANCAFPVRRQNLFDKFKPSKVRDCTHTSSICYHAEIRVRRRRTFRGVPVPLPMTACEIRGLGKESSRPKITRFVNY